MRKLAAAAVDVLKTSALVVDPRNGRYRVRRQRAEWPWIYHGVTANQQAVFYGRICLDFLEKVKTFKICGDYALEALLHKRGVLFENIDVVSVIFSRGGISSRRIDILDREASIVQSDVLGASPFLMVISRYMRRMNTSFYEKPL